MEPDFVGHTYLRIGSYWTNFWSLVPLGLLTSVQRSAFSQPRLGQLKYEYLKIQGTLQRCTVNKYWVTKLRSKVKTEHWTTFLAHRLAYQRFVDWDRPWIGPKRLGVAKDHFPIYWISARSSKISFLTYFHLPSWPDINDFAPCLFRITFWNIHHVDDIFDLQNKGDFEVMECKKQFLRKQKQD